MKETTGLTACHAAAALRFLRRPRRRRLPDLLAAVDHADQAYRQAALQAAELLAGSCPPRWTRRPGRQPEHRAEIVAMLGRQGDLRAPPFIRASLAPGPAVMLAAAEPSRA
jgi:HEAT repeat protein